MVALAWASQYDLTFSLAVADPSSTYGWFVSRFGEIPPWILILLCVYVLFQRRHEALKKYRPLAAAVIAIALLCPLAITQSLKFLWGRVRFVHLDNDLANYTPFYFPKGVGQGGSFPSGHVSMAFIGGPIPFYFMYRRNTGQALIAWVLVLLYGVGVGWGRIVLGMHYLTDTIFSAGLALLLSPLIFRWCRITFESSSRHPKK